MKNANSNPFTLKKLTLIFLLFFALSCSQSTSEKLALINGYWEIASVTTSEGLTKDFSISQNIDFIEIKNEKGIRKKVQADVMGNFQTTDASENIDVKISDNILILKYSTAFDTWNETVTKVTKNTLIIENDNGNVYTYRRYQPLITN